jgi:hypothetical protein
MARPPDCVAVVARHHWLMSGAIFFAFAALHIAARSSRYFALSPKTYAICLGLGALYGATGAMVWFGTPAGRYLNYVCSLFYLARPQLGLRLWRIFDSAEFKAHFATGKSRI